MGENRFMGFICGNNIQFNLVCRKRRRSEGVRGCGGDSCPDKYIGDKGVLWSCIKSNWRSWRYIR